MLEPSTDPALEVKQLQSCMNDLVSVLALPALWSGSGPDRILETSLEALREMLELDFVYARVQLDSLNAPLELISTSPTYVTHLDRDEIQMTLSKRFGDHAQRIEPKSSIRVGGKEIFVFTIGMGLEGDLGRIVAGSARIGFPEQTERLVLSVAANQAAIGLQQASRLSEQKRIAMELDHRVEQRTAELAEANEGLRREIVERKEMQERFLESEALLKKSEATLWRVIDTIPTLAWSMLPDGPNDFLSKGWHEYTGLSPEEARGWGWQVTFHREDLPPLMERWRELLVSGEPGEIEARLRRRDGVYRWFLIRVSPYRDETGTLVRWYGTSTDIDDLKLAQEELQRSEARYRLMVETASDAVVSIDEGGSITLANPAIKSIFGYEPSELLGKPLSILMPESMRSLHKSGYERYLETGERHLNWGGMEATAQRADGTRFPVEVSFGEMTTGDGKIFTGFIRDISDKKRVENAVRESERNLSAIINTMPVLAWSALPDGTAEFFNQRWLDYTGLRLEQAQGWGWADAVYSEDLGRMIEYWKLILAARQSGEIEARFRRFDGSYRWFLFRVDPMRDESGAVVKWYGTNTDIDDRKRAEDALHQRELNLREITETIPEMLWSARADGAIDYCNGRLLDYTGFRFDEIMRDGWMKLLHPDDVLPASQLWQSCVQCGAPYRIEVRTFHAADRTFRWSVTSALPLLDEEGRIVKWHGTVVDMHDWRQAQEELRATQAELARAMRVMTITQLTASIAHEVSQPLSGVITNAITCLRMLSNEPPNIDGARETARRMIRDGNRATDVIAHLRTLFNRKQVHIEPVDLNEATKEVVALLAGEFQKDEVLVQQHYCNHLPHVLADRVQLQQVILNLLRNGSDAMKTVSDRPRRLSILTEADGDRVRVSVQDSGVGFAPETASQIFDAFFTTKQDGMGIGLSVSRSIVEAHHGQLWATRNEGPGATFAFSIPCDREQQADHAR